MSDIAGVEILNVEGFMLSDDRQHAIVGVNTSEGQQLALMAKEEILQHIINGFIGALGAFAQSKMSSGPRLIISTDWFEISKVPASGQICLTFRLGNGGSMTFATDPQMASQIRDSLSVAVGPADISPPPGTSRQ